ncbi:hypothetical protein N478_25690 [Pseudoalteromonas luteoviolacea S4060-1]|uniref:Uncharacterized protein n=1 Tax=Pseudoalteromonas luteoviolacea S4060-1 TaxID=1365257 RepID=A0A162C550_9GAMM|nr:hypothetical protein N478_25690 [Pseudoalteromonas luteoviolacea S4060-1]
MELELTSKQFLSFIETQNAVLSGSIFISSVFVFSPNQLTPPIKTAIQQGALGADKAQIYVNALRIQAC